MRVKLSLGVLAQRIWYCSEIYNNDSLYRLIFNMYVVLGTHGGTKCKGAVSPPRLILSCREQHVLMDCLFTQTARPVGLPTRTLEVESIEYLA